MRCAPPTGCSWSIPGSSATPAPFTRPCARGARRPCTPPSIPTATSTTPSGWAPSSRPASDPQIVAQETASQRFHRYRLTHGLNARINQRQFGLPPYVSPSTSIGRRSPFAIAGAALGDLEVQLSRRQGRDRRHCFVWVPRAPLSLHRRPDHLAGAELRQPPEGAALSRRVGGRARAMAGARRRVALPRPRPGRPGARGGAQVLTETARYLRVHRRSGARRMNAGETPEAIFHAVEPDPSSRGPALSRGRLRPPEVHRAQSPATLGRLVDGDAADLLPATWEAQARRSPALAGGVEAVVARGRRAARGGRRALAAHLAEWATRAAPDDRAAQRSSATSTSDGGPRPQALMAQGFRAAMNDARAALGQPPLRPLGAAAL